ncbi:MAG TPA: extracellular solute-binding protein [Anaerolineales bacterium]|nr:extracellular solute-binding protein [Anaerolineales bacterium]
MKSKLSMLFGLLIIASMVLAACGGGAPATEAPPAVEEPAATDAPATEAPAATEDSATEAPAAETTTVTLWHSYHPDENEEKAFNQIVEAYEAQNPNVTIDVLYVPFDQLENKWSTEVAAGGGPDMFTMPNDNLGNWIRGGLVAPVDEYLADHLDGFSDLAIQGVTYEDQMYAVPGIAKAVGLFYNKSLVETPPTTTDELLAQVEEGKVLVMRPYAYFNYGLMTGSFGGALLDESGKCVADQGGFADAFAYMQELKDAGAIFEPDEGKANSMFSDGTAAFIVTGPWMLGTFKEALGDDLGVVPLPAGPGGEATPLTGIDGWYLNPNSTNQQAAIDFALYAFGPEGATIYADVAGAPMGRTDIEISDPMIAGFADIANAGFPRPQSTEFGSWWGAFDDATTKVLEGQSEPEAAVTEACAAMNTANNK